MRSIDERKAEYDEKIKLDEELAVIFYEVSAREIINVLEMMKNVVKELK